MIDVHIEVKQPGEIEISTAGCPPVVIHAATKTTAARRLAKHINKTFGQYLPEQEPAWFALIFLACTGGYTFKVGSP